MNALWINRLSAYRHSPLALEAAKAIIAVKIERQSALLKKLKMPSLLAANLGACSTMQEVLLAEARAAKQYWTALESLLPEWAHFEGRQPRRADIANQLLDIGYHHLTNKVRNILDERDVSPAMGILHAAHGASSAPLAYDLVELFRADVVDAETVRFLRMKKKPQKFEQKYIPIFLKSTNKRLEKRHYLKNFKQCHTYSYYMELQILKFIAAVNHRTTFEPIHLPMRHESRCRLTGKRYVVTLRLESVL